VPGAQQASADQIVNLALIRGWCAFLRRNGGRDDGVVVADFRVVYKPASQGAFTRSRRKQAIHAPQPALIAVRREDSTRT